MSSSRRRGRSSGSPATGRPAAAVDTTPETVAAEASQDAEAAETVSEAETETAAIPEIPAETSPETMQAAFSESVTETAEPIAEAVETVQEETAATVAEPTEAVTEQTADAVEAVQAQSVEQALETVEAVQEQVVEHSAETVDQVAETAMALAAAPLAAAEAVAEATNSQLDTAATSAQAFAGSAGVRFTFIPTFEPLNEINATLLAFARGEGEAAVAHLQALTKAKSPAEAIRLQVSEFQRAADASLTCFSHILRSANRFGGPTRWN